MRKVGNTTSNHIYNPENRKPTIPIDADEVDSAMERFIRQKYMNNVAVEPGKPNSARYDEGIPPPLPPKNTTKFGFRSASSIFPLSSRAKKEQRAAAASAANADLANKPSKVFGSSVGYDAPDEHEKKLLRLQDMGFQDAQRNAMVLKGVNGNLDRAVEALVRLGEGGNGSPAPPPPPREATLRATRSLTPLNSSSSTGLGLSLNVPQQHLPDRPTTSSTTSTNPFDAMNAAQPQTAHSTGSLHHKNPYGATNNPFGAPSQQIDAVSQAFQGLNLSPSQQSMLSQSSGGLSIQGPQTQSHQQYSSPSAPASPQSYQAMNFQSSMTYPPPMPQFQQPMQTGYNPFLTSQSSSPTQPQPQQQNLTVNTNQMHGAGLANNPFARSPTRIASPSLGQIPEQAQPMFGQSPYISYSPQPLPTSSNPFFTNFQPNQVQQVVQPQQQLPQQAQQYQQYQQGYYQPQRHDKASIMALYSQPGQAISPQAASEPNFAAITPSIPEGQAIYTQSSSKPMSAYNQPRSASLPMPSSTNPYANQSVMVSGTSDLFASARHISRESMNLGKDMAWTNGRHSPDAFASLSARHV